MPAADDAGAAPPLVEDVNRELRVLRVAGVPADARAAAWVVLRQLGFA